MILGMSTLTFVHVVLSLIGIFSGFVVVYGLLTSKALRGWNSLFLITTALTSITGFFFPFHKFLPSHALGIISLFALLFAFPALYVFHLAGPWRLVYVITALVAQYLDVFVLIAQLFGKVPALKAVAPTQGAPAFLISQSVVMLLFIVIGILAAKRFHIDQARAN